MVAGRDVMAPRYRRSSAPTDRRSGDRTGPGIRAPTMTAPRPSGGSAPRLPCARMDLGGEWLAATSTDLRRALASPDQAPISARPPPFLHLPRPPPTGSRDGFGPRLAGERHPTARRGQRPARTGTCATPPLGASPARREVWTKLARLASGSPPPSDPSPAPQALARPTAAPSSSAQDYPALEWTSGGEWLAAGSDDDLRRAFADTDLDESGWDQLDVPGHWRSHPAFADIRRPGPLPPAASPASTLDLIAGRS